MSKNDDAVEFVNALADRRNVHLLALRQPNAEAIDALRALLERFTATQAQRSLIRDPRAIAHLRAMTDPEWGAAFLAAAAHPNYPAGAW